MSYSTRNSWRFGWALALALLVLLAYSQTVTFDFLRFDDPQMVYDNPLVTAPMTPGNIWKLVSSTRHDGVPLAYISWMLDYQFTGLNPAGYHLSNVLWHAANAALLFLLLLRMTGEAWPSALATLLFALHPLRVESVAWIAERRDMLYAFFGLLAMHAHVSHARQPSAGKLVLVTLLGLLSLLSKQMLITLPVLLLVLDFWPLRRVTALQAETGSGNPPRKLTALLLEKLPLAVVVAVYVPTVLTIMKQYSELVSESQRVSLPVQLRAVGMHYLEYLRQTFWPTGLMPDYAYPTSVSSSTAAGIAALLLAITALAAANWRRRPYLLAGWLWFVISLIPPGMSTLVHPRADRYTYFPHIGLAIALSWLAWDFARQHAHRIRWVTAAAGIVLILLTGVTLRQTTHWRDSLTLWQYVTTVDVTNPRAHLSVGNAYKEAKQLEKAAESYRLATVFGPRMASAHNNLGTTLLQLNRANEAVAPLTRALELEPADEGIRMNLAVAHNTTGVALARAGQVREAAAHFQAAVNLKPDDAAALENLQRARQMVERPH